MTELNDIAKILDEEIGKSLHDVMECGYVFGGAEPQQSEALGEYLEARLIGARIGRAITVAYVPPRDGRLEVLLVHLEYLHRNSTFSLPEFLRSRKAPPEAVEELSIRSYSGPLEQRIRHSLMANAKLLCGELKPVVEGRSLVDVPFDWAGYK